MASILDPSSIFDQPDPNAPKPPSPEMVLRAREVEKLAFPDWVLDPAIPHTVAPVLAVAARFLVQEELGVDAEELPKMRALVARLHHTGIMDVKSGRALTLKERSGKELRRLLILADYVGRHFAANAMSYTGGSLVSKQLKAHPPIRNAQGVYSLAKVFEALAKDTAQHYNPDNTTEKQFMLVNVLTFTGLYFTSLVKLLQTLQAALLPKAPTEGEAADHVVPEAEADIMAVDGNVIYDLVTYAFSVYGAARVLAFDSLGGKGARLDVDRMGMACLAEMLVV